MSYSTRNYLRAKMSYLRGFILRLRKPDDHQFFGVVMVVIGLTIVHAIVTDRVGTTTTIAFIRERLGIPLYAYAILMMSCGGFLMAVDRPNLGLYLVVSLPVLFYVGCVLAITIVYQFPLTGAMIHGGMYAALLRDAGRGIHDATRTH